MTTILDMIEHLRQTSDVELKLALNEYNGARE